MRTGVLNSVLLGTIAVALSVLAARPFLQPSPVRAEVIAATDPLYVEPGVFLLRIEGGGQVWGKVVTNLRTGYVWGFPTTTNDPYPVSAFDNKPQLSHAIPLGRFALNETVREK